MCLSSNLASTSLRTHLQPKLGHGVRGRGPLEAYFLKVSHYGTQERSFLKSAKQHWGSESNVLRMLTLMDTKALNVQCAGPWSRSRRSTSASGVSSWNDCYLTISVRNENKNGQSPYGLVLAEAGTKLELPHVS